MQTRTKVTHKFEPATDDKVPAKYDLVRETEHQARRSDREIWKLNTDVTPYVERDVVATLTRRQVAALIADGADWLAYGGEDDLHGRHQARDPLRHRRPPGPRGHPRDQLQLPRRGRRHPRAGL
jgi:DNA-binding LacI/PurR family transcriptional regulator